MPTTTKPAKYGWLGSDLNATELPSGVVAMGARSYVPQIGRFLQTDPVPGGSANAYAYTYGDPVNSSDPSGEYTAEFNGAGGEVAAGVGAAVIAERKAAEEAAARVIAEQEAEQAAFWAGLEHVASERPEPPERVRRSLEGGPEADGPPVAEAAFHHTWTVLPEIAFALGSAITTSGTDIGGTLLGFVGIPGWIIQGIDAVGFRGRLNAFAGALMTAGAGAAPASLVEITLFGSLKYGLHYDIIWEEE